jgi:methionyl-tRNA synthetase
MEVIHVDRDRLKHEYGILCQRLLPAAGLNAPFGATHCVIPPGGSTSPHDHFEGESFYLIQGQGEMTVNGESRAVAAGDLVFLPSRSNHVLKNTGAGELVFLSIYWERNFLTSRQGPQRILVATAPPTPNGNLHLGHLSGPYIAADSFVRFSRMLGVDARYLSGSDDNQSYTAVRAARDGKEPQATADHFANAIQATLAHCSVQVDYFLRPGRNAPYIQFVQEFFERLREKGHLVEKDAPSLYCEPCGHYIYEAHVSGGCPNCQLPTGGNGCEACGQTNDCINLAKPVCNKCKTPAVTKNFRRFYFQLEKFREKLLAYHKRVPMNSHLRALVAAVAERGFPDISVTHLANWGIPVGRAGYEGQVIYEWFEMAAGYLFSARDMAPDRRWEHWLKDAAANFVLFFGYDNAFFYTSFIPALFMAYDEEMQLPAAFVANEFYRLDGLKFSTSRNHAIWGDEALAHIPVDAIRYYLAYDRPEGEETSFGLKAFAETVEQELAGSWRAWLAAVDARVSKDLDHVAPALGELTDAQQVFHERLKTLTREAYECYSLATFSTARATRVLNEIARAGAQFGKSHSFLGNTKALRPAYQTAVALELTAVKTLALLAAPVLPGFSEQLCKALGVPVKWDPDANPVPAGTRLGTLASNEFAAARDGVAALEKSR